MLISKIDTRHGTANQSSFSNGNCLPYTGVPFGMNYFAPQTTDQKGSWWFHPTDRLFQGFRITHQPSPWMGDFSHLLMTPLSGAIDSPTLFHSQSSYRPEESLFNPTELQIKSQRYNIASTLIPSMYGGFLEINYTQENPGLGLHLPGKYTLKQLDDYHLEGSIINFSGCEDENFTYYFFLSFTKPIKKIEGPLNDEDKFVILRFESTIQQEIRLGTSFISKEQAKINLTREAKQTKEEYKANTVNQWEKHLNKIEIEHHDEKVYSTFYHNLYRAFLFPQTFYEIDCNQEKIHYNTFSKTVSKGPLYTNNGFWDTYKTVYPLFSLIAVDVYEDILEGLLNSYKETGFLPKWLSPDERGLMPGTLVDAVIADAAVKKIGTDLMPELFEAMVKAANVQSYSSLYGRQGTLDYLKYGYVPAEYHESVNHTLDYAYSDFCLYKVADITDSPKKNYYKKQSLNYRNIFNPTNNFMHPKNKNGNFVEPFNEYDWGRHYAEGSAWQSSFAVFHDFQGLISLYNGNDKFQEKLIDLCNQAPKFNVGGYGFEIHEMSEMAAIDFGQLAISNQPSFHLPYLFSYIGKPEMAQPLIKQLMTQCFNNGLEAFPGDEDNGSMASWYIFNSLGFYPVTPGSGEYVIGIPLLDKAILHLSNGNSITITTNPNKPQNQFIEQILLNKEKYNALFFNHNELIKGAVIDYNLGVVPHPRNYTRNDLPFSLNK